MSETAPPRDLATPLAWFGVVLLTLCGAASAWLEALFVPYYVGGTLLPVTIAATVLGNWVLPRLARTLVPSTIAAVLPFVAWLAVIFLFAAAGRPEGDVILPGGGGVEYVGYAVMLGGALVATISIVASAPPPAPRRRHGGR